MLAALIQLNVVADQNSITNQDVLDLMARKASCVRASQAMQDFVSMCHEKSKESSDAMKEHSKLEKELANDNGAEAVRRLAQAYKKEECTFVQRDTVYILPAGMELPLVEIDFCLEKEDNAVQQWQQLACHDEFVPVNYIQAAEAQYEAAKQARERFQNFAAAEAAHKCDVEAEQRFPEAYDELECARSYEHMQNMQRQYNQAKNDYQHAARRFEVMGKWARLPQGYDAASEDMEVVRALYASR